MDDFVEATRLVGEHFALRQFPQGQFHLYVDEKDADTALLVGSWPDQASLEVAHSDVPPELVAALADAGVPGPPPSWRWYRPMREVMTFSHRPEVLVALRLKVEPTDAERFESWARSLQDAAAELPSVVSTRLLLARDQPGDALYLGEYRDDAGVSDVDRLIELTPPPIELQSRRRFIGRVGYSWERLEHSV
jgi:hypothetical protein